MFNLNIYRSGIFKYIYKPEKPLAQAYMKSSRNSQNQHRQSSYDFQITSKNNSKESPK